MEVVWVSEAPRTVPVKAAGGVVRVKAPLVLLSHRIANSNAKKATFLQNLVHFHVGQAVSRVVAHASSETPLENLVDRVFARTRHRGIDRRFGRNFYSNYVREKNSKSLVLLRSAGSNHVYRTRGRSRRQRLT
eukprot:1031321-Rhodomonas_salina.4